MPKRKTPVNEKQTKAKDLQKLLLSHENYQLDFLFDEDSQLVEPLLAQFTQQKNMPYLIEKATIVLQNLRNPQAQQALCQQVLELNNELITKLVVQAGYLPNENSKRALFLFLTQQWEAYDKFDFDQSLLKAAYEFTSDKIRHRVAQTIKTSGKVELLSVLVNRSKQGRFASMKLLDWELTIDMLIKAERWNELWEMAKAAPPRYSLQIMREFARSDWRPDNDQTAFFKLVTLAQECQTSLPPLGRLTSEQTILASNYSHIQCTTFSPATNFLVLSSPKVQCLEFWDILQGKIVNRLVNQFGLAQIQPASLNTPANTDISYRIFDGLAFSHDGQTLACWDSLYVWLIKVPNGDIIRIFRTDMVSFDLTFSPDDTKLIAYNCDGIRIWDLAKNGKIITKKLEEPTPTPYHLIISPDTNYVAATFDYTQPHQVGIWGVESGKLIHSFYESRKVESLYFTPDNQTLIVNCFDKALLAHQKYSNYWFCHYTDLTNSVLTQFGVKSNQCNYETAYAQTKIENLTSITDNLKVWINTEANPIATLPNVTSLSQMIASPNGQYIISSDSSGELLLRTSKLSKLAYQIIEQTSLNDLLWIQEALTSDALNPTELEKEWLRYHEALLTLRFQHEIELGEPMFRTNEFDIELESELNDA